MPAISALKGTGYENHSSRPLRLRGMTVHPQLTNIYVHMHLFSLATELGVTSLVTIKYIHM